jgi:putative component of membrane protein insertase Oxa1/YidC/SpoIIIJ protein YidD
MNRVPRDLGFSMRVLLLALVRLYQRFVSPYKGFRCAYRVHTGRASCSELGYRALRRHGVIGGLQVLRVRVGRCGVAHRRFALAREAQRLGERGDCDLSCDVPDLGDCGVADTGGDGCAALSFRSCACDWPWSPPRRKPEDDETTRLPAEK